MGQCHKLDVKDIVFSNAPHADGVASVEVPVQSRLRSVLVVKDVDCMFRCTVAAQLLRLGDIIAQSIFDLVHGWWWRNGKLQRYAGGVPIHDWDPVAVGRDGDGVEHGEACCVVIDPPEDLAGLPLDLLFLAADVGDDVVEHVHGGDAGIAAAGDGLEGGDDDGRDGAKRILERPERDNKAGGRAVCVCDDEALREVVLPALVRDHAKVANVDQRDNQRDERVSAVVFCV